MFSLSCLAFICKERADHNIYYTVCTVYTCISLSMFSNLSLPWEPWPNHTKHVNLDLNIWKWVIDHSYFHEGELHDVSRGPRWKLCPKTENALMVFPWGWWWSTVSLDLWLFFYRWFGARPREVIMKIGYETNVFGDSPRHGIMDLSWNGVGSRVFRLSLLSLSALCVLSFIGVHPCVFRVLSEKPWQGYLLVNSTPAPALNCAQNSSCPFLLHFSACW